MKKVLFLLFFIYQSFCFGQVKNTIKKYRMEINYQRHYSFRKFWWLYTDRSQNNYYGYAYTSPEDIIKREKEDSPVYSQSLGIKFNYTPNNWLLVQFGTATGCKGFGSKPYRRPVNQFPYPYVWERASEYKPIPLIEFNYSLGPQINLFKNKIFVFSVIGHSINLEVPGNRDKFKYRGIYKVRGQKGFNYYEVNAQNSTITTFMTVFNFGLIYTKNKYSFGMNGTYEWNSKRVEGKSSYGRVNVLYRNYIYSYGMSVGYRW